MLLRTIFDKATSRLSNRLARDELAYILGSRKRRTILARAHRLVTNVDHIGFKILKYHIRTPILATCERCHLKFLTPSDKIHDANAAKKYLWEKYVLHDCKNFDTEPPK